MTYLYDLYDRELLEQYPNYEQELEWLNRHHNEHHDVLTQNKPESIPTTTPTPGRFYQVQLGQGGLLATVGRAYNVPAGAERLRLAQRVNNHPLNQPFWVKPSKDFDKRHFPDGIISFNPIFTCELKQRYAKKGEQKCLPTIWMPPQAEAYHPELGQGISLPANTVVSFTSLSFSPDDLCQIATYPACGVKTTRFCSPDNRDDRLPVEDTTKIPYRWICDLILIFPDIKRGINWAFRGGTGCLISKYHILTSAHLLHNKIQVGSFRYESLAHAAVVLPGRSQTLTGDLVFPFAPVIVENKNAFQVPLEWREYIRGNSKYSDRTRYDYGMISLTSAAACSPLFTSNWPREFWGEKSSGTTIAPQIKGFLYTDLQDSKIMITGYPGDLPCLQWHSLGKIIGLGYGGSRKGLPHYKGTSQHDKIVYALDSAPGMSGSPVWGQVMVRGENGVTKPHLTLVGVHSGCGSATAITPFVWGKRLKHWMNNF